jgi:site-specific DNA recombinase
MHGIKVLMAKNYINFLLSNCTWEDGKVAATLRQPFDLLAETAATAARVAKAETAKTAKTEIWLGD